MSAVGGVVQVAAGSGPTVPRDLGPATGSDNAWVMRVVDDLEWTGPAVRRPVPGDRRVRAVEITPQCLELFDAAHVAAEPQAERLVAGLEAGEREQLTGLLTRFAHRPKDGEA
ncbi:MarR family winged helix-turn-helix transcriptional regulator [Streptomyces sp. NPDC001980]|uniref:MarR family winged helix-turn-helix transcriptional regulator n=1 Tax=Streptomyces sp. NPDC001980 TaxID=3157126 RepID=UPI00332D62BC